MENSPEKNQKGASKIAKAARAVIGGAAMLGAVSTTGLEAGAAPQKPNIETPQAANNKKVADKKTLKEKPDAWGRKGKGWNLDQIGF
ncbi:MAG: hypothetical protein Q7R71_00925 [bacterium]|nr:hypothetical protein [bacterium]